MLTQPGEITVIDLADPDHEATLTVRRSADAGQKVV